MLFKILNFFYLGPYNAQHLRYGDMPMDCWRQTYALNGILWKYLQVDVIGRPLPETGQRGSTTALCAGGRQNASTILLARPPTV